MLRQSWFFGLIVVCLAFSACQPSSPHQEATYPVSGTVTLDGDPLADGDINFITQATAALDVIPIKGGRFEGRAKAGKRRVEIKAYREEKPAAGGAEHPTMPGADQPTRVNYIPARYNTESTLTADVTEAGPNQFKFELTSGGSESGGATSAKGGAPSGGP